MKPYRWYERLLLRAGPVNTAPPRRTIQYQRREQPGFSSCAYRHGRHGLEVWMVTLITDVLMSNAINRSRVRNVPSHFDFRPLLESVLHNTMITRV